MDPTRTIAVPRCPIAFLKVCPQFVDPARQKAENIQLKGLLVAFHLQHFVVGQSTTSSDSSNFIGYYKQPSTIQPLFADKLWVTKGNFAGDCDSPSQCTIATGCDGNTLLWDNNSAQPWCAETFIFIMTSSRTDITSTSTSTPASPSNTNPTPTPSSTSQPIQSSATSSLPSSSSPHPPSPPERSRTLSTALVAIIVVASIVGLALVGAAVFFWMRKRQNKQNAREAGQVCYYRYDAELEVPPGELDGVGRVELSGEPSPRGLPGGGGMGGNT
ncbi:hypothetical protein CC80DRAFT_533062 [Byssothecium circinans]|uniref:Uncharacterized protein n=1 Tax=Byssothecium circinans TaxID=147558 RepID=A0A6A5U6T1_9PLEO|nr:hypothetical protein CC80DRAFT_533062 [Byssothecium circinans]